MMALQRVQAFLPLSGSFSDLVREVRIALRSLARAPAFAGAAIALLALGIGASTTVFSVVNAIYFRPLPYPAADRLAALSLSLDEPGCDKGCDRSPNGDELATWMHAPSVELLGSIRADEEIAETMAGSLVLEGADVTSAVPNLLGLKAIRGRSLTASDFAPNADPVLVLSYSAWLDEFGAAPSVINSIFTIGPVAYRVVGILSPLSELGPPLFSFNVHQAQYVMPVVAAAPPGGGETIVRLRPDRSLVRVRAELDALLRNGSSGSSGRKWRASLEPLHDVLAARYRASFVVLLGAVGVVLLVMCMNVAGLLVARLTDRLPQFATRSVLGASRLQLVRPIIIETMIIAVTGGIGGLLVALYGIRVARLIPPDRLPFWTPVVVDLRVALVSCVLALGGGLALSLAPGWMLSPARISAGIRDLITASPSRARLRGVIVSAEIALSVILLAAATMLTRQLIAAENRDTGLAKRSVIYIALAGRSELAAGAASQWADMMVRRLNALPDVVGVAILASPVRSTSEQKPLSSAIVRGSVSVVAEGDESHPRDDIHFTTRVVTPASFATSGTRLIAGRDFSVSDASNADPVAIIDETSARRIFGASQATGRRLRLDSESSSTGWITVVGIAATIHANPLVPDEAPRAILYRPLTQVPALPTSIVVRVRDNTPAPISSLRSAIRMVDPHASIADIVTAEEGFDARMWAARFNTRVLVAFAVLAIALACLGVYATMSYIVATRRREIAIRSALGATPAAVVATVMASAAWMLGAGLIGGVAGSLGTSRILQSLLYGTSGIDVPILVGVVIAIGAAGYAATWIPARRAARSDPSLALRGD